MERAEGEKRVAVGPPVGVPSLDINAEEIVARLSTLDFKDLDEDLQEVMREYDKELGGSGFVRVLAHAPEAFKAFIHYYLPLVSATKGRVDMRLTELARLKVAEQNDCHL